MSFSVPPKAALLGPGSSLDRYEILCPIAEGGMAAVWLARQHGKHGFRKLVAVKTILPKYASEAGFREMFLDEARVASRVEHMNVAQVLDLGEEQDVLYLVMEWVDGDSLLKLEKAVARKSIVLPQEILIRMLSDACSGLHAAHMLRDEEDKPLAVVHRDVSPQNLLVNTQGITKVIDFGIAKAKKRAMRDTTAGVVKGKLNYMAPEQALGQPVDCRADIWAIGAIFYRIVTGRPPFDASNPHETSRIVRTGKLLEPLTPADGVHPSVIRVIETALRPDPAHRFASASEMHDALEWTMRETGRYASSNDVSRFVAIHLADRVAGRKLAVQAALDASATREKLEGVLKPPTPSSNGMIVAAPVHSLPYSIGSISIDATSPRVRVAPEPSARERLRSLEEDQTMVDAGRVLRRSFPAFPRRWLAPLGGVGIAVSLAMPLVVRLATEEPMSTPSTSPLASGAASASGAPAPSIVAAQEAARPVEERLAIAPVRNGSPDSEPVENKVTSYVRPTAPPMVPVASVAATPIVAHPHVARHPAAPAGDVPKPVHSPPSAAKENEDGI